MVGRVLASVAAVLVLGVGAAYATAQVGSSAGTQVCVNETNGIMRATPMCREGEYSLAIGGGSDVTVTQNGTFTVNPGQSASESLPLTGITVTGTCVLEALPTGDSVLWSRARFDAASGTTMDIPSGRVIGVQSWTPAQGIGGAGLTSSGGSNLTVVTTSNQATATINIGATASWADQSCIFLWQATEAPN